ncbi:MAG: hypothetical protein ACKVOT_01325 [Polaromonas sp.]
MFARTVPNVGLGFPLFCLRQACRTVTGATHEFMHGPTIEPKKKLAEPKFYQLF